jgi:Secretion system C-terminal sorting domain
MRWLIIYIILFVCNSNGTAQYFNNTYNNSTVYAELSTHISIIDDGSYLIPSVSASDDGFKYNWRILNNEGFEINYISLLDTNTYLYPGSCDLFFETADGNFVQGQVNGSGGVSKYNVEGGLLFNFVQDTVIFTSTVMELTNGNIFLASKQPSDSSYVFMWLDSIGSPLHSNTVTPIDSAQFLVFYESKELNQNQVLLGGQTIFFRGMSTDIDGVMLRVDSLGNVMWTKIWDDDINDQRAFFCDGDDDSTVVMPIKKVVWYLDNDQHQPYTAHVGTALVNVNTGDTSNVYFPELILDNPKVWEIIRTPDQGYCLMGEANDDDHSFTFLMKLDQNRELEWYKTYAPEPPEIDPTFSLTSWDIEITPDSGFVVCGEATDWGNNGPNKQMPWVFKTDHCGELEWNNCGTIHVAALTKENMRWTVFPNPAKDILKVSLSGNTTQQHLSVFDATGKLLFEQRLMPFTDSVQLDIHPWPSGIYVVRLMDENGKAISKRVVKE